MFLHLIDRKTAKAAGLKRYFTGMACKRDGIGERYVSSTVCICARCLEYISGRMSLYYEENREGMSEKNRLYRNKNPEYATIYSRRYYKKNREQLVELRRRYREEKPHIICAAHARRRAAKSDRVPSWYGELDDFASQECASLAALRAEATSQAWHVDHMVPMQARKASGLHCAANLQVIPAFLNLAKGNRMKLTEPDEWLRYLA